MEVDKAHFRALRGSATRAKAGLLHRLGVTSNTDAQTDAQPDARHFVTHRAGNPVSKRRRLMTGLLTLSGLSLAAGLGITMMSEPSIPMNRAVATSESYDALIPSASGTISSVKLSEQWELAALGSDSTAHDDLLTQPYTVNIEIASGNTLMSVLLDIGLDRATAYSLVQSLSEAFDPRHLRPGQTMDVSMVPTVEGSIGKVTALAFHPDGLRTINVTESEDGYTAVEDMRELSDHIVRADGEIDSSLYVAARHAGVPNAVLGSLINIFSFDIDFQREVQPGDRFSLMFQERRTDEGQTVDYGDIMMAEMTVAGTIKRFYRFEDDEGRSDYYDSKGQSVRRALLRTPVEGARISSGFGKRFHPILGYNKMHKGLDFAASTGTPIYAAGDGVVEMAGWNGGYGRYIRIRHNGTYKTSYAHLSRIDSRIKSGARVDQRQIIGYVGTSGRSTGPHLHYEVHVNNKQVNPQGVKLPTGKTLKGAELARFESLRDKLESQYAAVEPRTQVAQAME